MSGIGIHDNDIAVVHKTATAQNDQVIVAMLNGEATVKRFIRSNRSIKLHAENPRYADIRIKKSDEFEIIGVVIGIIRRM